MFFLYKHAPFHNPTIDYEKEFSKNIEKKDISYFLNFNAILAAIPHDRTVNATGNTPLVSICGTCSMATVPELYIAAATGKATSPTTPNFLLVCSETFCCMLYVLIVIKQYVSVVLRVDLAFNRKIIKNGMELF